jgi:GNAT superfamily N-acetyltransferase
MLALNPVRRLIFFYRRHGLRSTVGRFWIAFERLANLGRMVLFSCALPVERVGHASGIGVERVGASTISKDEYAALLDVSNPSVRARQLAERFAVGSELWLGKVDGRLAGFGWTLQGRTIEPHFFTLQPGEVHLFDFFVFPEFRGRGVNVALVIDILARLGGEQVRRAHIECAAWNHAQIRSLGKTPLRKYGEATRLRLLGCRLVIWHQRVGTHLLEN